ncbi:MAG: hypothetical protein A2015_09935 [Spirochaetes bacterium GWF1_31_7]|nr:MAG: hypothetical protein A2Y30_10690 [Spirochaetes bacterium GWE1_32_154]OHD48276.1 MAG: hypothetical protein A2015_09935 [Spirochaetes bacterium GWF1_31_7]OHD51841.1 MAG: hypothetical protein A2Y29_17300 [Spirochaetes bacterium GWE2_31_10]HBD94893.1 hypothetical protein [Spirochaetia bacterium]HBI37294.1 hypothetical protein [Spirochaetia bacterium]
MPDKDTTSENKTFGTFHGLVKDLTEYEKTNLLNKLLTYSVDNTNDNSKDNNKYIDDSNVNDKVMKYANKEFLNYGILRKIITYIIGFFNGISPQEVIINKELNYLKKDIEFRYSKYININENKLKPISLEKIIPLMAEINTIKTNLNDFFENKVNYYEFLVFVIENENLSDLTAELDNLSPDNLDNKPNYLEKNNYLNEKEKRIKSLFGKITSSKYYDINKEMLKLDLVFKLIDYDFTYFTNSFNYKNFNQPFSSGEDLYLNKEIIDYLERMYRLIISVDLDVLNLKIISIFLNYLKIYFASDTDFEAKIDAVKNSLIKIINMINDLRTYLPYENLIKYLTGNILKITKPYQLKMNIVEMYKAYKRTFIDKLWDSKYIEIKERNIKFLVNELFGEYKFDSLSFFDKDLMDKLEKYSGLKVKDYYILNILYKFISTIYSNSILPVVNKFLIDGIFAKDIVKSNFSAAYYSLKSASDKINLFDMQYKEDNPLRKKINNTLVKISSEPNFKSILYNIIADINEDTYKIKFEIYESIKIMNMFFKSLNVTDNNYSKVLTNLNDIKIPMYPNVIVGIEKIDDYFTNFVNIYSLIEESF